MRRRVVIFDDNDLIRHSLGVFFDRRGYEVFTFSEPSLCPLHVVRECPCPGETSCADLIISDVEMWNANGIEQLLMKGCKQKHFALMSGNFSDADLARASKIGCVLFTKPLEMDTVEAWVKVVETSIPSERVLYDWVRTE